MVFIFEEVIGDRPGFAEGDSWTREGESKR